MKQSPVTFEQRAAILHEDGHAIISAVAGSGKSTTLIERIAYLLTQGADARRILVLMFNKSARDDFAARLERRLPATPVPSVFTFHAFGLRLCEAMVRVGLLPPARLLASTHESLRFLREVLSSFNSSLSESDALASSNEALLSYLDVFDLLKGALYVDGAELSLPLSNPLLLRFLPVFERFRKENGVRFFADLVSDPVLVALSTPDAAKFISDRYDHIIVDEFQDINEAQISMLSFLAGQRAQVMVVGDEDQTIYGWRGACPDYMTHLFSKRFPGATSFTIGTSFRYGHAIALMANHVISNNALRTDKRCISSSVTQTVPHIRLHQNGCGLPVVEELVRWQQGGRRLSEAVILVRHYANALPVEIALHNAGIPYRIVGSAAFVDRTEIVALRGYLQLACGGLSCLSERSSFQETLTAMFSTPQMFLRQELMASLIDAVDSRPDCSIEIISARLREDAHAKAFQKRSREKLLADWIWCATQRPDSSAGGFLNEAYLRLKLFAHISRNNPRIDVANEKIRLLHQLVDVAFAGNHTIQSFLSFLDGLSNGMTDQDQNTDAVLVTSVHRSKGMEWPMVILPDLADGLFPCCSLDSTVSEIEDERRLFYVGMTRARDELVLVAPFDSQLVRWSNAGHTGHPDLKKIKASRFLYEANIDHSVRFGNAAGRPADD